MQRTRIAALGVIIVSFWAGPARAQNGPPPARVVLETVTRERVADARGVTGEIRSRLRSALAAQVAGLVVEMDLEDGDRVEQGDIVARLDDERARAALARAESELASARAVVAQRSAELDEARRDLSRLRQLEERGGVNPAQLDAATTLVSSRRALLAASNADLLTAEADLSLARRELEDMTIEAPFSGRVVASHAEVGEWVGAGDPVCTIVSLDALEARIDVPEGILGALESSGQRVELSLPAVRTPLHATVISIVPEADSLSRLFPVRLRVEDPERVLRPGMSLTAMVPTGTREALLTVSKDAILRNDAGSYVYMDAGGVARVAPIERRFAIGERVVIRSPVVREGTRVVVEGNERLFPGQPLMVIERAPPSAGPAVSNGPEG